MKLKNRLINIIYGDNRSNKFPSMEFFLFILSKIYSWIADCRIFLYRSGLLKPVSFDVPVISIGNIAAGGTGKTPLAVNLCRLLLDNGFKPAVVMRGYKGNFEKNGGVVSDGERIVSRPDDAGDEAWMIASILKGVPVLCGHDRVKSIQTAINELGSNIIILDDGLQHLKVKRDIDILLLDFNSPFGNGFTLPRGILREKKANAARADIFIFTRSEKSCTSGHENIFFSRHRSVKRFYSDSDIDEPPEGRGVLFSGIGNNNAFLTSLQDLNFDIAGHLFFDDHHKYTKKDISDIIGMAEKVNASYIVTTMKDHCRFFNMDIKWPAELVVMDVEMEFFNDDFHTFFIERVKEF